MASFKSRTVITNGTPERVFATLSNPEALGALLTNIREKASTSGMELPADVAANLDKITLSDDSISINGGPTGALKLVRSAATPCSEITFTGENTPIPLGISFHISPEGEKSNIQAVMNADVPIFLKPMIAKPMQQAVDMFATLLEKIPSWE